MAAGTTERKPTSRGMEGRFQGILPRMAATLFSSMTEAKKHFGLSIRPNIGYC